MDHFEVAMGLVRQGETYVLQLRNGKNQAGGLNLIGCFGGKVEIGETPLEAACRELAEESTFAPDQSRAILLGEVDVLSERHNKPITVHATIYLFELTDDETIQAREGEAVRMMYQEIMSSLDRFTSATRSCFEQLIPERT